MSSTTKLTHKPSSPKRYGLVPRVIKNDAQHRVTMARIEKIFNSSPGTTEGDELELLLLLIEKYEEETVPMDLPDPVDATRFRMAQSDMKPKDLIPYFGSLGRVNEVLNRRRPLTLAVIRKLVDGLKIPPAALLPKSTLVR